MKGEVVTVPFPFYDLSSAKPRPVLVLIELPGDDVVVAMITSTGKDPNAVNLQAKDFETGGLSHDSFIRPAKLFTIQKRMLGKVHGKVSESKRLEVVAKLTRLLS